MPMSTGAVHVYPALIILALLISMAHAEEPSALTERYGDWTVQCRTNFDQADGDIQRTCQISQELRQPASGSRVILVAFTKDLRTGGAMLTLVAPFGLLLPEGFGLSVDEVDIGRNEFKTCISSTGCIAEKPITPEQLSLIIEGNTLTVHTATFGGQKLVTNLSLDGFGVAFRRLLNLR